MFGDRVLRSLLSLSVRNAVFNLPHMFMFPLKPNLLIFPGRTLGFLPAVDRRNHTPNLSLGRYPTAMALVKSISDLIATDFGPHIGS